MKEFLYAIVRVAIVTLLVICVIVVSMYLLSTVGTGFDTSGYNPPWPAQKCPHYEVVIDKIETRNHCLNIKVDDECPDDITIQNQCENREYFQEVEGKVLNYPIRKTPFDSYGQQQSDVEIYRCVADICGVTEMRKEFVNTEPGATLKNWKLRIVSNTEEAPTVVNGRTIFSKAGYSESEKKKYAKFWIFHKIEKFFLVLFVLLCVLGISLIITRKPNKLYKDCLEFFKIYLPIILAFYTFSGLTLTILSGYSLYGFLLFLFIYIFNKQMMILLSLHFLLTLYIWRFNKNRDRTLSKTQMVLTALFLVFLISIFYVIFENLDYYNAFYDVYID